MPGEQLADPLALRGAGGHHDEAGALPLPPGQLGRDGGERAVAGSRVTECQAVGRVGGRNQRRVVEHVDRFGLDPRTAGKPLAPGGGRQVEALGWWVEASLARGVRRMRFHLHPARLGGGLDLGRRLEPEHGIGRQVIRHAPEVGVEVGEEKLRSRQHEAGAHGLDEVAPFAPCKPELGRPLVDRPRRLRPQPRAPEFRERQQQQLVDRPERALRGRVEGTHALDRVAHELQAGRLPVADREDVQDAAPQREVAGILHQGDAVVAPLDEPRDERVRGDRLPRDHVGNRRGELGARQAAQPPRLGGRDHDGRRGVDEVVEALGPGGHRLARRRQRLEGRHLPAGKIVHPPGEGRGCRLVAQEEAQVGRERLGLGCGRGHDQRGPRPASEQPRQAEGRSAAA